MKRDIVTDIKQRFGLSERRACGLICLQRSTCQYKPTPTDDDKIVQRMKELAQEKRRYGSRRLHQLLRKEGLVKNHKKTERLYREEGLSIRTKKRKKLAGALRLQLPVAESVNQIWAMDFVSDSFTNGRRFRCLNIVDTYTRECLAIHVDTSISGHGVVRILERLGETRGLPETITTDNGPEFISKALSEWSYRSNVKIAFIRPGKPIENAYIESFNGKLRDECLNEHWFLDLKLARMLIENWRLDYNHNRPHSALKNLTPMEFREKYVLSA